jgi:outer membrane receptor protein involved in Fe transport
MRTLAVIALMSLLQVLAHAQTVVVTISGIIEEQNSGKALPYVNVQLKSLPDSAFVGGTVTNDAGFFSIGGLTPREYVLETSYVGFEPLRVHILVGRLSNYLDLGRFSLKENVTTLQEITVEGQADEVAETMEKKVFSIDQNIIQNGGSLLQVMQNLPGVTVSEGSVRIRGSDRVALLVDGKQTALTGFGNQSSLDNIPASAIDRIEVINNPSARYDANGNAGIINIIYKKQTQDGFNGKAGIAFGAGALWIKKGNFPAVQPQYQATPKVNPSLSLNYRRGKTNVFLQADNLYTQTLNKNEFVDRYYDTGDTVRQQTVRNRNTNVVTTKAGADWQLGNNNTFSMSALFSSEKILDHGEEPFYSGDLSERMRLWKFLEDELKTTVTTSAVWQHKYQQPGRSLTAAYNYTFHREDEKYFFTNVLPGHTSEDSFKLLSDEHVSDLTLDYVQPLRHGRLEAGTKFRIRRIPTNMRFFPGDSTSLDVNAGGWATYSEIIPALYANYVYESKFFELEAGIRGEYVKINYEVDPKHPVYSSSGYHYTQPFPNLRLAWKIDNRNTLSLFYNRRVDRPNEVDIRIFPKYDDAEIIKVGNPALRPQYTSLYEMGYKANSDQGYAYVSLYHRRTWGTIARIASIEPGNTLIYNIFQNTADSYATGIEIILSRSFGKTATVSLNLNGYRNHMDAFTVVNLYPSENTFTTGSQDITSGSVKLNGLIHLPRQIDLQFSGVYLASDVVPQGRTYPRFGLDAGLKKTIQSGKGELIINATDLANTMVTRKKVTGDGFKYMSSDYYETQVIRIGYAYKF